MEVTLKFRRASEPSGTKASHVGTWWSDAPGGGGFVVAIVDGQRKFVRVKKVRQVWVEVV